MKRLLLSLAAVACGVGFAASAHAHPGVDLAWTNCYPDGGINNISFACNTNSGTNVLVGSYITPDAGILQVSGNEVIIDIIVTNPNSPSDPLPDWWKGKYAASSGITNCRPTSFSSNFIPPGSLALCTDYWQGQASGGIGQQVSTGSVDPSITSQHTRFNMAIAVPQQAIADQAGATEYFSFNFTINNAKTVGSGACTGCLSEACIVLNSINVTTPVLANNVFLSGGGTTGGSDWAHWNEALTGADCALVPTHNTTWGQIKALYR